MPSQFGTLEQVFTMFSPVGLSGLTQVNLGDPLSTSTPAISLVSDIIETDGNGVLSAQDLLTRFENVGTSKTQNSPTQQDINFYFDFYSTVGFLSYGSPDVLTYADGVQGGKLASTPQKIGDFKEVFEQSFSSQIPPNFNVTLLMSRSPHFHPSRRNAKRVEIFLNSMPSLVLSSLVPYLDVEFQTTRDHSNQVQSMGTLKFLLGSPDVSSLSSSDAVMLQGRQITVTDPKAANGSSDYDYAGMELFTTPQTMVNPSPNLNVSSNGMRYSEVLNPFAPFASLESVTMNVTPSVGMFTYKKASMTLKLHDRSRLAEIRNLLQPTGYGNTTVWMTYGWRAPVRGTPGTNPYFDYINNNMLVREAFGVINSSFSFDKSNQVNVTLDLFTKGVVDMQTLVIGDTLGGARDVMNKVKQISQSVTALRKKLKLDPPEGTNADVRIYQLLDSASAGEFPTISQPDKDLINSLNQQFSKGKQPNKADITKLQNLLKQLYVNPSGGAKSLSDDIDSQLGNSIKKKFDEVLTGPDPFLPTDVKTDPQRGLQDSSLPAAIKNYNTVLASQNKSTFNSIKKKVVSFAKLFTVFAVESIITANIVDEVQVFFYSMNEQCGPVSGHSVGEFPIQMDIFLDQYKQHVRARGSENVTLEDFLSLIVNAQILDDRSIGYGLTTFYDPWDPKNPDAKVATNKEKDLESAMSSANQKNGPFKKPAIQMDVEVTHSRPNDSPTGSSDILNALQYSAKDAKSQLSKTLQANKMTKIMRIHIYDKTANTYSAASTLLRGDNGRGYMSIPSTDYAKKMASYQIDDATKNKLTQMNVPLQKFKDDLTSGVQFSFGFTDAKQVKALVSKLVPTITYGANGSTIHTAALSSKNDPLNSTVNMLRVNSVRNKSAPNGSGENGIPLRVVPATLTLSSMGCPLLHPSQVYFCDFNTGTSLDGLYILTHLTHVFGPGKFESQMQYGFADGYGVFEGAPNVDDLYKKLDLPSGL